MLEKQQKLILSGYMAIYDLVVPKDNLLRKINDLVDFEFIYEELSDKYSPDNGRNAINPITMFKYLLLKTIYDLSDVDVVDRAQYDMSFKYFLGMAPEDPVINPSSLTKFRKLRLKDTNLLDLLITKTVGIALEKKLIKTNAIIVDATHTKARYNQKTPCEILRERSKNLRKAIYEIDNTIKEQLPAKNTENDLDREMSYGEELLKVIKNNEKLLSYPKAAEKYRLLEETLNDDIEHKNSMKDDEARIGHKTADSAFFGYKTHLAMTEERIITAATITTGEKNDGKELEKLYEKSKATGMMIQTIIGDSAYSEKANIEMAQKSGIKLVAKLNPSVTQGTRSKENEFEYNKDAGMYVCKAGHMAVRKARQGKTNTGKNQSDCYYFDIEKCKICPMKEGCCKEGAKSKTYSVTIKSDIHKEQIAFQETPYFQEKAKERYKIEAKNSELKHRHGYDVASSSGLIGMEMQGAMALFTVNLKRILRLLAEQQK